VDIVLVAGLWLDGSAWDAVVPALEALGHRPVPLTLPGQGDGRRSATLGEQVAAVLAAVDAATGKPLVAGHSAACTLAWLAADARTGAADLAALGQLYARTQSGRRVDLIKLQNLTSRILGILK